MTQPAKPVEEGTQSSENMSLEQLIAQRTAKFAAPTEEEPTEEIEQPEEEPEDEAQAEPEDTEEEIADDEDPEEEQPEIDLLSLTPEQIQDLAKRSKSRLLKDIGKLRAENRHLNEQLTTRAEAKPIASIPAEENPFRDLKTVEEVQAK